MHDDFRYLQLPLLRKLTLATKHRAYPGASDIPDGVRLFVRPRRGRTVIKGLLRLIPSNKPEALGREGGLQE